MASFIILILEFVRTLAIDVFILHHTNLTNIHTFLSSALPRNFHIQFNPDSETALIGVIRNLMTGLGDGKSTVLLLLFSCW